MLVKSKLYDIRTSVWVQFGAIQCFGELFDALFVAVHFPVATDEKLPASHDCRSPDLIMDFSITAEVTVQLKRQREAMLGLSLYRHGLRNSAPVAVIGCEQHARRRRRRVIMIMKFIFSDLFEFSKSLKTNFY